MNKILIMIFTLILLFNVSFADTNGIWIRAEDIRGGVFASDENSKDFSFVGLVNFNNRVNLNSDTFYKGTILENVFVQEGQVNSITTDMIQNGAVTGNKIADSTIGINKVITSQFDNRYVQEGQANSITTNMIQNGAVTGNKIADNTIGINKVIRSQFDSVYATRNYVDSSFSNNFNFRHRTYSCSRSSNYNGCSGLTTSWSGGWPRLTTNNRHHFCTYNYNHHRLNQWLRPSGSRDSQGKTRYRLSVGWGAFDEQHTVRINCYDLY